MPELLNFSKTLTPTIKIESEPDRVCLTDTRVTHVARVTQILGWNTQLLLTDDEISLHTLIVKFHNDLLG